MSALLSLFLDVTVTVSNLTFSKVRRYARLHRRLSKHRAHHEWFRATPEVRRVMQAAE